MTARQSFTFPPVAPEYIDPEIESSAATRAEYAAAMPHKPVPCRECNEKGHVVTWRVHPRPGPFPPAGIRTELVSCCTCCAWSCTGEPFVERLQRESFDDHDVQVERLIGKRWVLFEQKYEVA